MPADEASHRAQRRSAYEQLSRTRRVRGFAALVCVGCFLAALYQTTMPRHFVQMLMLGFGAIVAGTVALNIKARLGLLVALLCFVLAYLLHLRPTT